jgi:AmmeMemoRadiSam system protein B/AmmeMemoRadiSam system protein A
VFYRKAWILCLGTSLLVVLAFFMIKNSTSANAGPPRKRSPSFAGSWYEADADKLKRQLDNYLERAATSLKETPFDRSFQGNAAPKPPVLAIVAPHAGYMFSGQTAAFGYQEARLQKPKRIFLLGPSHYVGFEGAMLPAETEFSTPLGDLQIDTAVIQELKELPLFRVSSEVHKREHSLEMQLPLIKETFGDVLIVPIIVGNLGDETEVAMVGAMVKRFLRPGDLIVVSSDFTHFGPRYEFEPFRTNLKENIRLLDSEAFQHLSQRDLRGFMEFRNRTSDTICGFYPCSVLLSLLPAKSYCSLLNYRTSQDTLVEDDRNSVSYMALAFSNPDHKEWGSDEGDASSILSAQDKKNLLLLARKTLEKFVKGERNPADDPELKALVSEPMHKKLGVFVTLYKVPPGSQQHVDRMHKDLRGCIGYIWPVKSLFESVIDNTIGACSRDHRFVPVNKSELEELQIDINVLTPPRRVGSYKDIVVGRDGVILYKDGKQAVFLPSVATEFGWDVAELLTQLSLKAGCGADAWKQDAKFDVFQSDSFEEGDELK